MTKNIYFFFLEVIFSKKPLRLFADNITVKSYRFQVFLLMFNLVDNSRIDMMNIVLYGNLE